METPKRRNAETPKWEGRSHLLICAICVICGGNSSCISDKAVMQFGESFRQWQPLSPETARALGEGVRPQVTVIDAESAAILAAAVERGLAGLFAPQTPTGPPAATSDELWKGLGGLAALYGVNQVRKWLLSRKTPAG